MSKYIKKNDIFESTCLEVAVSFPLNTYLVCYSLTKLGRQRPMILNVQCNFTAVLQRDPLSHLKFFTNALLWELWVFLLPHRCLTNDADQNCSSPECCGKVYNPIKGIQIVSAFKRWCM